MKPRTHSLLPAMRIGILLALFCAAAPGAWAHPHIWIDSEYTFEYSGEGLTGLRVLWSFDSFFTAMALADLDVNGDGSLQASEINWIRDNVFTGLAAYDYYFASAHPRLRIAIPEARDFNAYLQDRALHYEFFLPLRIGWNDLPGLVLSNFDPSYYSYFTMAEARHDQPLHDLYTKKERQEVEIDGYGVVQMDIVHFYEGSKP